jgi:8-oxo-dGTP diphosphatase
MLFQIGIQVIIEQNGAILLGRRKNAYGSGTWGLPGGRLEPGESFEAAAARELREETALVVRELRVFSVVNDPSPPHSHHIQIGMIATSWHGEIVTVEAHRCEGWMLHPLTRLPNPLFPSSAPLIEHYMRLRNHNHTHLEILSSDDLIERAVGNLLAFP